MQYHNRRLRVKLRKHGTDYEVINFNRDFPQLEEMNPMFAMNRIRLLYESLPDHIRQTCSTLEELKPYPEAGILLSEFKAFLTRFGHLSDSGNDCSVSKWEEYPDLLFEMIRNTSEIPENRELINFEDIRYPPLKKRRLRKIYSKAGRFKVYREEISSLFVFGYGIFRYLFLSIGKEFTERGIIDSSEDIFFLTRSETDDTVAMIRDGNTRSFVSVVQERKDEMENSRDIVLPTVIIGDHPPIIERETIKNLNGVASSSGTFRGKIKIIGGVADFKRVEEGDVLVIPFSDVSWTPVLVKAGAIISESGGMLSHCSIIAREMGIPALVSVENACSLPENITVTVDGSNGILTIHDNE
jgi:pyruvate,water dikinase